MSYPLDAAAELSSKITEMHGFVLYDDNDDERVFVKDPESGEYLEQL